MNLEIDIKSGSDYGFPKQLPQRLHNSYQHSRELQEWFLECGYPKELFDKNKWTITTKQV